MRNVIVKNVKIINVFIFFEFESVMLFKVFNCLFFFLIVLKDVISFFYELRGIVLINVFLRIFVGS